MKSTLSIFVVLLLLSSAFGVSCPIQNVDGSVFFGACALGLLGDHTCYTTNGTLTKPLGSTILSQISVGFTRICGLDLLGFPSCASSFGRTMGTPSIPFSSINVGSTTACGVSRFNQDAICFVVDATGGGFTRTVTGPFSVVKSGIEYACGLRTDGSLSCWGNAASIAHAPLTIKFKSISLGHDYNCGIAKDGSNYCWDTRAQYRNYAGSDFTDITCSADQPGCCGWNSKTSKCWGTPIYPADSINAQLPTPTPVWKTLHLSNAFGVGLVSSSLPLINSFQFFSGSIGGQNFNKNIPCTVLPSFAAVKPEQPAADANMVNNQQQSDKKMIAMIMVPIGAVVVLVAGVTIAFVVQRLRQRKNAPRNEDEIVELNPISS